MQELIEALLRSNVLWEKKWVSCGDSFTEGDFNDSREEFRFTDGLYAGEKMVYPFFIGRRNRMTVVNEAKCGNTITNLPNRPNAFSIARHQGLPADADYITLRLRVNAKTPLADIRMLISGTEGESIILLDATASVSSGEWADVTFSLDALKEVMLSEAALKIWVRTDAAKGETVLLDVASVLLHSEKNMAPMILFLIFLGMAFLAALSLGGVFIFHRMKKPSVK